MKVSSLAVSRLHEVAACRRPTNPNVNEMSGIRRTRKRMLDSTAVDIITISKANRNLLSSCKLSTYSAELMKSNGSDDDVGNMLRLQRSPSRCRTH